MKPEISVRYALPKDVEACLSFDCTDPTASRGDQEKVDLVRAKIGMNCIYVAVTPDDHPVGYLSIDRLWPMMLPLLSWIYVAPAWRQNRVAFHLWEHCLADLKTRGYSRILVSTQADRPKILRALRNGCLQEIGTLMANPDDATGEIFFMKVLE